MEFLERIKAQVKEKWLPAYKKFCREYEDYLESAKEFAIIYFFSNIPYIALVFIHVARTENAVADYETARDVIIQNINSGELLIYVATLLAPFVFIMIQYHKFRRVMPFYGLFLSLLGFVYCYCLLVFGMYRLESIKNPEFIKVTAAYFYGVSLILWYCSLVFGRKLSKSLRPDLPQKSGAEKIMDNLNGI